MRFVTSSPRPPAPQSTLKDNVHASAGMAVLTLAGIGARRAAQACAAARAARQGQAARRAPNDHHAAAPPPRPRAPASLRVRVGHPRQGGVRAVRPRARGVHRGPRRHLWHRHPGHALHAAHVQVARDAAVSCRCSRGRPRCSFLLNCFLMASLPANAYWQARTPPRAARRSALSARALRPASSPPSRPHTPTSSPPPHNNNNNKPKRRQTPAGPVLRGHGRLLHPLRRARRQLLRHLPRARGHRRPQGGRPRGARQGRRRRPARRAVAAQLGHAGLPSSCTPWTRTSTPTSPQPPQLPNLQVNPYTKETDLRREIGRFSGGIVLPPPATLPPQY